MQTLDVLSASSLKPEACLPAPVHDRTSYPVNHIAHRFGVRLRDLRKANNLTQSKMAAEFGIDRSFISDLERGQKAICLPLLDVLARGLHLSLSDLLHDL